MTLLTLPLTFAPDPPRSWSVESVSVLCVAYKLEIFLDYKPL